VDAPDLRIMSEELWTATQTRIASGTAKYLRTTNGQLWGRQHDQESKFLLTGFMRCSECGATMVVTSRSHGHRGQRRFFYRCLSVHKRGPEVCQNNLLIPMETADRTVLDTLLGHVLTADVIEDTIRTVLAELAPSRRDAEAARLRAEATQLDTELARLAGAVATTTDPLPSLLVEIATRERRKVEVAEQLARAEAAVPEIDIPAVRTKVAARLEDWRAVLMGHTPQARLVLRKLITQPMRADAQDGHVVLTGNASYTKLLQGISGVNTFVASPTGFEPVSRP
jgi:hypothetical protein